MFFNLVGCMINGIVIILMVVKDLELEYIIVINDVVYVSF